MMLRIIDACLLQQQQIPTKQQQQRLTKLAASRAMPAAGMARSASRSLMLLSAADSARSSPNCATPSRLRSPFLLTYKVCGAGRRGSVQWAWERPGSKLAGRWAGSGGSGSSARHSAP